MPDVNTTIRSAGAWFLNSGIREANGGVARYYRSDLQRSAPVSTEITAYAVSFLVDLHGRTKQDACLDAALLSANFLARQCWSSPLGLFPFELAENGAGSFAFFFDCGIIVRGLLAAYRVTGTNDLAEVALACGKGMLAHFRAGAVIHPILNLPSRTPQPHQEKWSAQPGCYQLKSAMAWLDLFNISGEREFLAAYDEALHSALTGAPDFLPGSSDPDKVMDRLHAYLYFLEGLLPRAGDYRCRVFLETGIERVASYMDEIGGHFLRSDVVAQLLRVRLLAAGLGSLPLNAAAAEREAERIGEFWLSSDDSRIDGAFAFGVKRGDLLPYVNPVSTAFCAQALAMWDDRLNSRMSSTPDFLV